MCMFSLVKSGWTLTRGSIKSSYNSCPSMAPNDLSAMFNVGVNGHIVLDLMY